MPAGWGAPRLSRRGPSTGVAWVPTADPRFRRQERLRVSVGVGAEAGAGDRHAARPPGPANQRAGEGGLDGAGGPGRRTRAGAARGWRLRAGARRRPEAAAGAAPHRAVAGAAAVAAMSTSRVVRSLVVAAGICVLVGTGPGGRVRSQQTPPPQAEPTFRTDANYVLTDVFVTADGKPVTDLTAGRFRGQGRRRRPDHPLLRGGPSHRGGGRAAAPQPVVGGGEQRDGRRSAPPRLRGVPRHLPRDPRRIDGRAPGAADVPQVGARRGRSRSPT